MLKRRTSDDPAVQELLDRAAIRDCLMLYTRAIDRRDFELLRSVYWPDAMDEHGAENRPVEAYITWVRDLTQSWARTMHTLGQMLIQVEGDKAVTETYFTAFHLRPDAQGRWYDEFVAGRYLDAFEKRQGEWRIAQRVTAFEYFRHFPDPCQWESSPFGRRKMGQHKPGDALYPMLGALSSIRE